MADLAIADGLDSVYSLFSALIMHVYQMRSSNQTIKDTTQHRLTVCMNALKDVSKVWLVAKMVHTLFESILGNKLLEERLQKAAGKRHAKSRPNAPSKQPSRGEKESQAPKRKFDDIEIGFSGGPPAAQMSYERSRPVSPVGASLNEQQQHNVRQQQQIPPVSIGSPPLRQGHDAFMGVSRSGTRPTTPFPSYSYPGTPPDLFLHTRNSPNISQDLWQNYQPDQLFPPDAAAFNLSSPNQHMVDPTLRATAQPVSAGGQQAFAPQANMQAPGMQPMQPSLHGQQSQHLQAANGLQALAFQHQQAPNAWAHLQAMEQQHQHQQQQAAADHRPRMGSGVDVGGAEDTWSNSSTGGPIVPTTLNVGDWYIFLIH